MDYAKEVEVAKRLALHAGEIMLQYFDADQQVQVKADQSPVTVADTLINDMVIEELSREFPEDGIIGEEKSTAEYGGGRKWFCDPIDGTSGYIAGSPTAMFSLALVIDGVPVVGVAYDPFLKRMYEGVQGVGSFCNSVRLEVSKNGLRGGRVGLTSGAGRLRTLPYIPVLEKEGVYFSVVSGAVYKSTLVARGKLAGYIEAGVCAHDMAAVQVIVEEAGGRVTGMQGEVLDYNRPFQGAITSNSVVHERLVEIVNTSK
ncbi:MAG: inositol monophosphatase [bacterium]